MNEIRQFLESNGYKLKDLGTGYWSTIAHFRGGQKETSLNINQRTGAFRDWVTGVSGSFKDLICLISGEGEISDEKLKELLEKIENQEPPAPKIEIMQKFDKNILLTFLPDYQFFLRRGISAETQKLFGIGLATSGKLRNRYVVPIICYKTKNLIGLSGRYYKDNVPEGIIKWKHLNSSSNYLWPMYLNDKIIREKKEIIICESPGDLLALWEMGKKNTICSFGTKISAKTINYISGIQGLKKIWVSLNNDLGVNKELAGNTAAEKWKVRLGKLFDKNKIEIVFPPNCNDWGDYFAKKILTDK